MITTAGHVDHGKSTLIERLTGIDPDRLAEEKRRGMTIDLGFAWLTLPSGAEIGIVDVPGHERFVPTMLAGAGSVDGILFVVDANEGWMPQSEEHLQILDLLGAQRGVVALTKCDRAADLDRVGADVGARLAGTGLANAPIVAVSAATGAGLDDLRSALDRMLTEEPPDRGRARLYVDRVFSAKGSGTIVTGTLNGGTLHTGDDVMLMPEGLHARIRGIQSHKESREQVSPVARVALNLAGIERAQVHRGQAIVRPDRYAPTTTLDVELRAVRSLEHAITSSNAFKFYIGSSEVDARISFHDAAVLRAGERTLARMRLDQPVIADPFDRFVVRDAARSQTVGGGVVLDPYPIPLRGPERTPQLNLRGRAQREDIPTLVVAERGVVDRGDLERLSGSGAPPRDAVMLDSFVLSKQRFAEYRGTLEHALSTHHAHEPLSGGMPREEARIASNLAPDLFAELVDVAPNIVADGPTVRLATHQVNLDPAGTRAILDQLEIADMQPPPLSELEREHGARFVNALIDAGTLVKIDAGIAFAKAQIDSAKDTIATALETEGPMTAARIKEILGTSRKYAIPLLEYLDRTGFTRRDGDRRTLRS